MARIMVVDDDPHILKYCDSILAAYGHEVLTCADGDKALDILATHNVSLLIVDVVMPKMNGFDLLRAVKRFSHLTAPILMLTGRRAPDDVKRALELGATDYIVKPLDKDVLLAKIESILGSLAPAPEVKFASGTTNAEAELVFPAMVTNVTELGLTLRTTTYLDRNVRIRINSAIFAEIGMQCPPLRTAACKLLHTEAPHRYEVFVSFIGLDELAMQKIRRWIASRTIALRKAG